MSHPSLVPYRLALRAFQILWQRKSAPWKPTSVALGCPSHPIPAAASVETQCLIVRGLCRAFLGMKCKKGEQGWRPRAAISHSWNNRLGPQAMVTAGEGLGFPVMQLKGLTAQGEGGEFFSQNMIIDHPSLMSAHSDDGMGNRQTTSLLLPLLPSSHNKHCLRLAARY